VSKDKVKAPESTSKTGASVLKGCGIEKRAWIFEKVSIGFSKTLYYIQICICSFSQRSTLEVHIKQKSAKFFKTVDFLIVVQAGSVVDAATYCMSNRG
jgi:hypothetical protein